MMRLLGLAIALGLLARPAMAAPPSVEAYGRLPNVEMMRLSPAGDKIAYVTVDGSDRKLHVISTAGKSLHDLECHDIKLRALDWADDDHVVLTASVTMIFNVWSPKSEFLLAIALNVPRHAVSVVLSQQNDLLNEIFGEFGFSAANGHAYGYFGAINKTDIRYKGAAFVNLYRIDLDTGDRLMMYRGGYHDENFFVDPASGSLAAASVKDEHNREWRIEDGGKVLASGRADYGAPEVLGFGRTPGSLLISLPHGASQTYSELSLGGQGLLPIDRADDMGEIITARQDGRWIGAGDLSDAQTVHFFDAPAEARLQAAEKAVGGSGRLMSFSDDLSHMILFTEADRDSGTWWLVDADKGQAKVIGRAYPDVGSDQVGEVKMVSWKAVDGLELNGVLTLPPGKSAAHGLPLVVLPHGGPQARDYPHFDWWAQAFAARGYAVFQPNFRGSDGYGPQFVEAGFGQWGRKMQTDISDGVASLASQGVVDPKRACIVGASYGGYAALAGVTVQQGLYRCAVAWGAVTDPKLMLQEESPGGRKSDAQRYWRRFMGADAPGGGDLDAVSPLHLAARTDAPVLVMYGRDDTVVSPDQSKAMIKALKAAAKPVEIAVMPGEDHWLSKGATRTAMLEAAVDFVQKHNPAD